jgi:hypothetical protein
MEQVNLSASHNNDWALFLPAVSNNIEVSDGTSWIAMYSSSATIGLDSNTINILKWAQQKMLEEAERNELAKTNPAIKDLVNQIKDKEEQLSIVQTLIKEEEKV